MSQFKSSLDESFAVVLNGTERHQPQPEKSQ